MTILSLLAIIASLVIAYIFIYNGLVQSRIACDTAWAQITVQLKRRQDLVPNLVETVKGYAAHEKDTLLKVVEARNSAVAAKSPSDQIAAENQLSGALRQLFALAEAYPDLKANQNFLELQTETANTENLIAGVRQVYNDQVQQYNTKIQQIPANFIAARSGFTAKAFFELSADQKAAAEIPPKISF